MFTAGAGGTPNMPAMEPANTLLFGAVRCGGLGDLVRRNFVAPIRRAGRPDAPCRIPRAMFWIVIVFVVVATIVAFWIGHPLINLSFANEKLNAAFRYALVRLRDAAEAVGFYQGEQAERTQIVATLHADHRQLPPLCPPHHRLHRLELVGQPGDYAAAVDRSGAATVFREARPRRRHANGGRIQYHPELAVVLPQQLRRVCVASRFDNPVIRPG